jgi:hypothetical protein
MVLDHRVRERVASEVQTLAGLAQELAQAARVLAVLALERALAALVLDPAVAQAQAAEPVVLVEAGEPNPPVKKDALPETAGRRRNTMTEATLFSDYRHSCKGSLGLFEKNFGFF